MAGFDFYNLESLVNSYTNNATTTRCIAQKLMVPEAARFYFYNLESLVNTYTNYSTSTDLCHAKAYTFSLSFQKYFTGTTSSWI
jgi:hypothetical protein